MNNPFHWHSPNALVERYIGTAYDTVKAVAAYIPWLDKLVDWLGQPSGMHPPAFIESNAPVVLSGVQTVNGFVVPRTTTNSLGNVVYDPKGTRVLIKDQTDPTQNGIYVANHLGAWLRAEDFKDSNDLLTGQLVTSTGGGISSNVATWMVETNTREFTDGVTEIMFSKAINALGYADADVTALNLTNGVRNSVGYQTADEIRALPVPTAPNLKAVWYGHGGGIYLWDSTSTLPDDGSKVLKLNSVTNGRFLKVVGYTDADVQKLLADLGIDSDGNAVFGDSFTGSGTTTDPIKLDCAKVKTNCGFVTNSELGADFDIDPTTGAVSLAGGGCVATVFGAQPIVMGSDGQFYQLRVGGDDTVDPVGDQYNYVGPFASCELAAAAPAEDVIIPCTPVASTFYTNGFNFIAGVTYIVTVSGTCSAGSGETDQYSETTSYTPTQDYAYNGGGSIWSTIFNEVPPQCTDGASPQGIYVTTTCP